jgi:zinc transport system substrate-binding protein
MVRLLSLITNLLLLSFLYSNVAHAVDSPNIMVSIKPFYNLCARVMQSVGTPQLLLRNNASPHDYQLKPSEVALLEQADLIIWGGPELETFLQKTIANLPEAKNLELAKIEKLKLLPLRSNTNWESDAHEHCCGQHGIYDQHFWLNPENAIVIANAIAAKLSSIDPSHAKLYKKNANEFAKELRQQVQQWRKQLQPMQHKPFIVFHDAYQYFDNYFALDGVGSITLSPEIPPSAQRIQQIETLLKQEKVVCIFSEPQFNSKIITTLSEDLHIYHGKLDPLGQEKDLGPNGYIVLLNDLAAEFSVCSSHSLNVNDTL